MPSCQKNIPKVGDVSQLWSTHPVLSPRLGHRPHPVHRRVPKRSKVSRKKLQKIIFTYLIGEIINHLFNLTLSRLLHGGFFFCAFFFLSSGVFPNLFFVSLSLSVAQTVEDSGSSESICLSKNYSLCYCLPLPSFSLSRSLRTIKGLSRYI